MEQEKKQVPSGMPKSDVAEKHIQDDSNNKFETTSDGTVRYTNEDIIPLQRDMNENCASTKTDPAHLTKDDRVF